MNDSKFVDRLFQVFYLGCIAGAVLFALLACGAFGATPEQASFRVAVTANGASTRGSGTAIHPNVIVTCAHVVRSDDATVEVYKTEAGPQGPQVSGPRYKAQVIGFQPHTDVALLWVHEGLPHVELATQTAAIGETVSVYGYGRDGELATGRGRVLGTGDEVRISQVIESGDSGSGVFNEVGELVAMSKRVGVTGVFADGGYEGQGVAVPLKDIRDWVVAWEVQHCPNCNILRRRGRANGGNRLEPLRAKPREEQPSPPLVDIPKQPEAPSEITNLPPAKTCECDQAALQTSLDKLDKQTAEAAEKAQAALAKLEEIQANPGPPGPPGKDAEPCDQEAIVAAILEQMPKPESTIPATGTPKLGHAVLIVDRNNPSWQRIESTHLLPAREVAPVHVVPAEQLSWKLSPVPQLVVYDTAHSPMAIAKGVDAVEKGLQRIARKEF